MQLDVILLSHCSAASPSYVRCATVVVEALRLRLNRRVCMAPVGVRRAGSRWSAAALFSAQCTHTSDSNELVLKQRVSIVSVLYPVCGCPSPCCCLLIVLLMMGSPHASRGLIQRRASRTFSRTHADLQTPH